jgi:hypothetical protein
MKKLLFISLFLLAFSTDAFARAYLRDCLIGGTSGCIDDLDITAVGDTDANNVNLADGDIVVYGNISGTTGSWAFYIFDADGNDEESSPDIIRPDDYATGGVWRRALLRHEEGGLEADVSAYSGIVAISGGVTYELNSSTELEAAAVLSPFLSIYTRQSDCSTIDGDPITYCTDSDDNVMYYWGR